MSVCLLSNLLHSVFTMEFCRRGLLFLSVDDKVLLFLRVDDKVLLFLGVDDKVLLFFRVEGKVLCTLQTACRPIL